MRPIFAFTLLSASLLACSLDLHNDTTGQKGRLAFSYESSQCFLGCALDRPVAEGALITVDVKNNDTSVHYTASIDPPSMGTIRYSEGCSCDSQSGNTSSSRSIDHDAQCNSGETKECSGHADIQTQASGTATLIIRDPQGNTVDQASFAIKRPDRVETKVRNGSNDVSADSQGTYHVHIGDPLDLDSTLYAGGDSLVFTEHGVGATYSNEAVVAPRTSVIGATDTEYALAKAAGTASITMSAGDGRSVTSFQVDP